MVILEHGRKDRQIRVFRCPACGCLFQAAPWEYERWPALRCVCPDCGATAEEEETK